MRFGLVVLGIIFLVIGGVLFYYPSQTFSAQTDSGPTGESNPVTSSAIFSVPVEWSYALLIMGGLFLLIGLLTPSHVKTVSGVQGPRGPRGTRGRTRTRARTTVIRYVNRPRRRARRMRLPRGTSVTTVTTRTRTRK